MSATLALSCIMVLPNSPRWLMLHGQRDEALKAVERLNIPRAEAEKDILRAPDTQSGLPTSRLEGFVMIFRRQYRSRTFLALFVLGMVQLSGIDGVLYVRGLSRHDATLTDDHSMHLLCLSKPAFQSRQLASSPPVSLHC